MARVPFIVLASSRRGGGRCIAGWRLDQNGGWVRPISSGEGALELEDCEVKRRWPEVLDVVRAELVEPVPKPWHPEDWLIGNKKWEYVEKADPHQTEDSLASLVDHDARIVSDTRRTVPAAEYRSQPLDESLVLVEPEDLRWRIERAPWGALQRKANFRLSGDWFEFMVTDCAIEAALSKLPEGTHDRQAVGIRDDERVFLTVSVSAPWDERDTCSKLVAGVVRISAD